ncbi:MAG TPA: CarD family transcriptional regulator [Hyphomicrobiaceae bacterium]|nr:CarD family transcriptional regulator [Hyphomicrobiaceae bacterium]
MAQKKMPPKANAARLGSSKRQPPKPSASKASKQKASASKSAKKPAAPKAVSAKSAPKSAAPTAKVNGAKTASVKAVQKPAPVPTQATPSVNKVPSSKTANEKAAAVSKAIRRAPEVNPAPVRAAPPKAMAGNHTAPVAKPAEKAAINHSAVPPAAPAAAQQRAMPAAVAKPAAPRLTAPAQPAPAAAADPKKPVNSRHGFRTNEFIVYPAHGVGRIMGIEEQEIAGISLELFVIQFEKDKMTLRVPTSKLASVGMRKLAEEGVVKRAMETLKGKARIKRTMWSRRAQEYEAKINSGDLVAIAEVVRDLYRSEAQPEQSYSERQLYEAALDRMAREIAAVDKLDERGATQRITEVLAKSARGRRAAEEAAESSEAGAEVKAA